MPKNNRHSVGMLSLQKSKFSMKNFFFALFSFDHALIPKPEMFNIVSHKDALEGPYV